MKYAFPGSMSCIEFIVPFGIQNPSKFLITEQLLVLKSVENGVAVWKGQPIKFQPLLMVEWLIDNDVGGDGDVCEWGGNY